MNLRKIGKVIVTSVCIGCLCIPTQASTLSDAKNTKQELENNKSKAKKQVETLQKKQKKLEANIKKLDKKLVSLDEKLHTLTTQLEEKKEQLQNTKKELANAKQEEQIQYTSMKKRIKYMYESGDTEYLDLIFQAKSIGDLLNRAEYVSEISEYDHTMLERLEKIREKIAATKEKQEQEIKEVKQIQTNVKKQRKQVTTVVSEKKTQMKEYESSIKKQKSLIQAYEKQIDAQNKKIIQLEEEARKKAEQSSVNNSQDTTQSSSSSSSSGSGGFTWPAPSSHTITSPYGYRVHPILGTKKFHSGIDIGASYGSSIVAASSGTVIAASYNSSMGNYVMISHGGGITTVYMHCSSLLVSSGQSVSKGQQIARVGSTGRSTGPHLHFSVMKNGSYVSPWGYVS